ncbi:hypothetical protein ACBJ59_12130 [Nonomuraea sp. MTCD27]|uniref:hypothetical protein n=1 Tax=Nonomuraea sp. MTCD27 TaxID=1676747 RepID=UPI0035C1CF9A
MAIERDLWFVDTQVKTYRNQIALDLGDTTAGAFKLALFNDTVTPDASQTNPAYGTSPLNTGEVTGAGYTAGGLALTSVLFEEHPSQAGFIRWKFANLSWPSSTIPAAKGALTYVPGLSNRAVLFRTFGQEYSSQDGTFAINFHADGISKLGLLGPIT